MKKKKKQKKKPTRASDLQLTATKLRSGQYFLKLYVTGTTPQSQRALANIKKICEDHLDGKFHLQVIDIYQKPFLAKDEQIIAAPTLIKVLPLPLRRFIGDLSNEEKVLLGLDIRPKKVTKSAG
jgi:circadian clock protein KaiB